MLKRKFTFEKRQLLEKMNKSGVSVSQISKTLGVSRDTVYRELKRGGTPYRAIDAQKTL